MVTKLLEGELVRLVPYEKDSIPTYLRWFNDPEVKTYINMYLPLTFEQLEERYKENMHNHNQVLFSVLALPSPSDHREGKLIGNVGAELDWKDRVATFGIMIGEKEFWGKGYGTDATRLFVNYLFQELNMHRIELTCFNHNLRAKKCYEKVGFIEEGIKRRAKYQDGKHRDVVVMGILRDEWNK